MRTFKVYKLGLVPYAEALRFQMTLLEKRRNGEIEDTLLLLEHPPTFTTGRGGDMKNLLAAESYLKKAGIHFEVISRGGDITFHGPGQLVGYPVMDLNDMGRDIHKYLRNLEEVIILTLRNYGIESRRIEGVTGVWVKWHKIASIGVGVKRWITYHGFALNVNTDLSYFDMIVPCGIQDVKMTTIQRWLASKVEIDMAQVEENIVQAFSQVFNLTHSETISISAKNPNDESSLDILLRSETII
ncbi:MAG: lipoyl(octanoyl) transferase LipB [Deltaproteobacteria bacterium]